MALLAVRGLRQTPRTTITQIHGIKRISSTPPSLNPETTWQPSKSLDDWIARKARPISLRQLTFIGRTLTEERLLSSANYVRTEVPTRLAHRLHDIQALPYVVVHNTHFKHVYDAYFDSFERYRNMPPIKNISDNEKLCDLIRSTLTEHLTIIPRLARGVLEVQDHMTPDETDNFMATMLKNRISRRVIAEQHLALTHMFDSPQRSTSSGNSNDSNAELVGDVFLRCQAKEVVERVAMMTERLMRDTYGEQTKLPKIKIEGETSATFPYIISHLEYIIGELLRNSMQAVVASWQRRNTDIPPIEVLICETEQHVIIRISDEGGGVSGQILPYLWSFSKGPRRKMRMRNLSRISKMAATLDEVQPNLPTQGEQLLNSAPTSAGSLTPLTARTPDIKLGIGLPMSKIYAEYWAGSLAVHSLEGFGTDAFLQISKIGNKNEDLTTRASLDAM